MTDKSALERLNELGYGIEIQDLPETLDAGIVGAALVYPEGHVWLAARPEATTSDAELGPRWACTANARVSGHGAWWYGGQELADGGSALWLRRMEPLPECFARDMESSEG